MIDRALLTDLLHVYPHQPAAAFFRAVELTHLLTHGPVLPSGQCLDFGCGDGHITRLFEERQPPSDGRRVWYGVDTDPYERLLARSLGFYSDVFGTIPSLAVYDFAFSNSVLEHIDPDEVPPILERIRGRLTPGSLFLLTVPAPEFTCYLRTRNLTRFNARHALKYFWGARSWTHVLRGAGFEDVTITTYFSRAEIRRWEALSACTSGVLCALTRHQARPIELQRQFGWRRGLRMPRWLASGLARMMTAGLQEDGQHTSYAIVAKAG